MNLFYICFKCVWVCASKFEFLFELPGIRSKKNEKSYTSGGANKGIRKGGSTNKKIIVARMKYQVIGFEINENIRQYCVML